MSLTFYFSSVYSLHLPESDMHFRNVGIGFFSTDALAHKRSYFSTGRINTRVVPIVNVSLYERGLMPSQACFASYVSAMPASVHMELKFCECFWNTNNCCLLVNLTSTENFEFFRLFLGFYFAASGRSHCMCSLFRLFFSLLHLC